MGSAPEIPEIKVPSTEFTFREMDGEAISQLHRVLEQVEEGRGMLVRLADLMGGAVGQAARLGIQSLSLSPNIQAKFQKLAEVSLENAFSLAILGIDNTNEVQPSMLRENMMQAAVAVSGAVGGFGGILSMAPDIGFTTLAIMREIASIARENGEDLRDEGTRRACLEVFALRHFSARQKVREEGGDEAGELGFFAARSLMRGQPLVLLMAEVAGHYGIGLSRKFAAQMIPVAGALCGASLNSAFLAHYRAVARAHFTIRRLERIHGAAVREAAEAYQGQTQDA